MRDLCKELGVLADKAAGDGLRYWVNDSEAVLNGTLTYAPCPPDGAPSYPPVAIENYVGLVDENDGGMIAYGTAEVMERLADDLNLLDVVERLTGEQK